MRPISVALVFTLGVLAGLSIEQGLCQVGGAGSAPAVAQGQGEVSLEFEELNPPGGQRVLRAHVRLENMEPYQSILVAFENENPVLRYSDWHADGGYRHRTIAAPVTRGGQDQVLLGVMGGGEVVGTTVDLGYIEMDVLTSEVLELTESDLALVDASIHEATGGVVGVAGFQSQVTVKPVVYTNSLAQNYPNPFNPSTTIAYSIAANSRVELRIYNVRGQLVRTLIDSDREPNNYRVIWNGRDNRGDPVASGVYFYRLIAGDFKATKKMVLLR